MKKEIIELATKLTETCSYDIIQFRDKTIEYVEKLEKENNSLKLEINKVRRFLEKEINNTGKE